MKKVNIKFHPGYSIVKAIIFWIAVLAVESIPLKIILKIIPDYDLVRWWNCVVIVSIIATSLYIIIVALYIKNKSASKALIKNGYIYYKGKSIELNEAEIDINECFFKSLFDVCDVKIKDNYQKIKLKNVSLEIKRYL